jgi:hypothetical protein
MKETRLPGWRFHFGNSLVFLLTCYPAIVWAIVPNEWRFRQTMEVPQTGLIRVNLPAETLGAARPDISDIRIIDANGRELPFVIDRPLPQPESVVPAREFLSSIDGTVTRLQIVTGTKGTLRSISLAAPGRAEFIKPVRVEGSHDDRNWRVLADYQPIFRMAGAATELRVLIPEGTWEFLRLTIDDNRSAPVPFTGAELHIGTMGAATEPVALTIRSRDENPGVTRLALELGAMNLTPAALHLEVTDPLFSRDVTVAVPQVSGSNITEEALVRSVVYRIDVDGKPQSRLDVAIDRQIDATELLLLIENGDSPPLTITALKAERRDVGVMFSAPRAGRYVLLSGNSQCAAPNYDLSALAHQIKAMQSKTVALSAIAPNPDYKAADALAAVSFAGAKIDVAPWSFRKAVKAGATGTQEFELDVDVLAHANRDLGDLRLVSDDRQIPFLLEKTSITRMIPLQQSSLSDSKKPNISRWSLKLPKAGLPISRILCRPGPGVFHRELHLFETVSGGVGEDYRSDLAGTSWTQTLNQKPRDLAFELSHALETDTLILETDNGDNPAIELSDFRAYYPVTRAIFKSSVTGGAPVRLYYGNSDVSAPHYDMSLVAPELLRSERVVVATGPEEVLNARAVAAGDTLTGPSRYIFWGVLALVVVGLLALVARFIPKAE